MNILDLEKPGPHKHKQVKRFDVLMLVLFSLCPHYNAR